MHFHVRLTSSRNVVIILFIKCMCNIKQQWVNTITIPADWLGQSNIFKEFERKLFSKLLLLFLHIQHCGKKVILKRKTGYPVGYYQSNCCLIWYFKYLNTNCVTL